MRSWVMIAGPSHFLKDDVFIVTVKYILMKNFHHPLSLILYNYLEPFKPLPVTTLIPVGECISGDNS